MSGVPLRPRSRTFLSGPRSRSTELMPVGDKFPGERTGKIRNPSGHVWNLATDIDELSAEESVEHEKTALGG